jgi:hypothetical protein
MKQTYWIYQVHNGVKSDKMMIKLDAAGVRHFEAHGYTVIPYDPNIPPHESNQRAKP